MEKPLPDVRPRELFVATALLWAALAAGVFGAAIDFASSPRQESWGQIELVIEAVFVLVTAVATYYFSMARNWARIASLVLLVMNLIGAFALPSMFDLSVLVGCLYVSQVLMQALAMYLAYATPASKFFRHTPADDAVLRAVLPVGRSGWAIAAGYLALFSVLLLPAPFALLCGLLGVRDIKRNPGKHGMGRAVFGVVMGSIGIIVLLVLFLIGRSR